MKYHIRVAVSKSVYGPFHRCPAQAARVPQYYRYCTTLLRYFQSYIGMFVTNIFIDGLATKRILLGQHSIDIK